MPIRDIGDIVNALDWRSRSQQNHRVQAAGAYRPLNQTGCEIRVLNVEPGSGNEAIRCRFEYRYLRGFRRPRYETISYVWADASVRVMVMLNGEEADVPASCERVLRRFRYRDKPRILWIDALCINQQDNEEKTNQVALMYEIYGWGKRNLVWLGESTGTTATALKCIERIEDEMKEETSNFKDAYKVLVGNKLRPHSANHGLSNTISATDVTAITDFYTSNWFQRLWVLQEAALADRSICYYGEIECNLRTILRAAKWLHYKRFFIPYALVTVTGIENASNMFDFCDPDAGVYHRSRSRIYLLRILTNTWNFKATEAKDHIFAIFGLAFRFTDNQVNNQLIRPDYTQTTARVFTNATMYSILQQQDLGVLSFVEHRYNEASAYSVPSWVPSYDRKFDFELDAEGPDTGMYKANFGRTLSMTHVRQSSEDQLCVTGLVVSEVEKCSILLGNKTFWRVLDIGFPHSIYSLVESDEVDFAMADVDYKRKLAMVVTLGKSSENKRWNLAECDEASAAHDRLLKTGGVALSQQLWHTSTEDQRLATNFRQAMYVALKRRRLFVTSSRKFGVGPQTMEAGDVIAVLFSCHLPVVLRSVHADRKQYMFIGTCYLYGAMDGEAVEEHHAAAREDVEFVLI